MSDTNRFSLTVWSKTRQRTNASSVSLSLSLSLSLPCWMNMVFSLSIGSSAALPLRCTSKLTSFRVASADADGFPSFLPRELHTIQDPFARKFALRIQRLPVPVNYLSFLVSSISLFLRLFLCIIPQLHFSLHLRCVKWEGSVNL